MLKDVKGFCGSSASGLFVFCVSSTTMKPVCHPSFCRYNLTNKIIGCNRLSKSIVYQRIPHRNISWFGGSKEKPVASKTQTPQSTDIKSLYKQARSEYKDRFQDTKDAFDETTVVSMRKIDGDGRVYEANKIDYRDYKKIAETDPEYPRSATEEPRAFRRPAPPIHPLTPGLLLGREELYKSMLNLMKKRKRLAWKVKMQRQLEGAPFRWLSPIPIKQMTIRECLEMLGFFPWEEKLLSADDIHARASQLAGLNHPDIGGNPFFYRAIEAAREVLNEKYDYIEDERMILAHNDLEVLLKLGLDEYYKYMKNQIEFNLEQIPKYDFRDEILAETEEEKELQMLVNSADMETAFMGAVWKEWKEKEKKNKDEKEAFEGVENRLNSPNMMYLTWKDAWKDMQNKRLRNKVIKEDMKAANRQSYYGSKIYLPGAWKE